MTTETLDQTAERIVRQEVYACVSALVCTLAKGYGALTPKGVEDLAALCEQAFGLASPIPDYESAAKDAHWSKDAVGNWAYKFNGEDKNDCATAEEVCAAEGIDPYDRDVYEHWIVSDWFAEKLEARGEKIDKDFAGLTVWARTTTGQSISMDSVIQAIAKELA